MNDSHSQSDLKLPQIDIHSQHRLPIRMDPSFRVKYTNPIRVHFLRYMERRNIDEIKNETYHLEQFAKTHHYPYIESHKFQARNRVDVNKEQKIEKKKEIYQKPNLKYFNPDDSDVNPEQVKSIFMKNNHLNKINVEQQQKVFISE